MEDDAPVVFVHSLLQGRWRLGCAKQASILRIFNPHLHRVPEYHSYHSWDQYTIMLVTFPAYTLTMAVSASHHSVRPQRSPRHRNK